MQPNASYSKLRLTSTPSSLTISAATVSGPSRREGSGSPLLPRFCCACTRVDQEISAVSVQHVSPQEELCLLRSARSVQPG